jgi:hypothetical protein
MLGLDVQIRGLLGIMLNLKRKAIIYHLLQGVAWNAEAAR